MSAASCLRCIFSEIVPQDKGLPVRVCRRLPPIPINVVTFAPPSVKNPQGGAVSQVIGHHAPVRDDTWCGEFREKLTGNVTVS